MAPLPDPGLQGTVSKVDEQNKKVVTEFNNLNSKANDTLGHINTAKWVGTIISPGSYFAGEYLMNKIRDLMKRLKDLVEKVTKKVQEILDKAVPVYSMITRAFDWVDSIQPPLNDQKDRAGQYTLHANEWSGLAKTVYDQRVPGQVSGIEALATAAADIGAWLMDLAKENAAYILSLFDPLVHIVSALVAAAVDAGSMAGILEAIGKGAELVQTAIDDMWEALKTAADHALTVVQKKLEAHKVLGDLGDSWPQMVNI
jgi:hypothetical protein